MNKETFVARDSKSALEKVKSKLGADALILSTRRGDAGVEVTAIDGDMVPIDATSGVEAPLNDSVNDITLGYLDRELKTLREVLYNALGERAWREVAGKKPVLATLEQRLATLGLSRPAIEVITSNLDTAEGLNSAWSAALNNLMSCLNAPNDADPIIDFCKREKVKRIHVKDMLEARLFLKKSGSGKKVIVEAGDLTPSLGTKDPIFDLFNDPSLGIEIITVLPATYQSEILRSVDQHTKNLPISGGIISKVSEAVSLGAILDILILSEIPLMGVSRPFDSTLQPITPRGLIRLAKRLARDKVGEGKPVSALPTLSRTA